MFSKSMEQSFKDIFSVGRTQQERIEAYHQKRGPYVLEYEANGEVHFSSGSNPADCIQRTNEKHDSWEFIDICTQDEWFKKEMS